MTPFATLIFASLRWACAVLASLEPRSSTRKFFWGLDQNWSRETYLNDGISYRISDVTKNFDFCPGNIGAYKIISHCISQLLQISNSKQALENVKTDTWQRKWTHAMHTYFSGENYRHSAPVKHIMYSSCWKCKLELILVANLCHSNQSVGYRGANVSTHDHRDGNMDFQACTNGSNNDRAKSWWALH